MSPGLCPRHRSWRAPERCSSDGVSWRADPAYPEKLKVTSNLKGSFVLPLHPLCMKELAAELRIHNLRHPETKGVGQI